MVERSRSLADRADTRQANPAFYPGVDWVKVFGLLLVVLFLAAFWFGVYEAIA